MKKTTVFFHLLIISSISFLIYLNHFQNEFVYDDAITIQRNSDIKHIKKAFSSITHFNTRPVIQISYAIDYHFSHLKSLGYHITNIFFHFGTTLLLYWMVFSLSEKKTYSLPFISAFIFALHPLNTESVGYLSSRASIFLTFFYLLSICFFIQGMKFLDKKTFFTSFFFFFGTILFFIIGWLSKTNIATLPLVLIGIHYFFYSSCRSLGDYTKKNKAFLLVIGLVGIAAIFYGAQVPNTGADKYSSFLYFASQMNAIPLYYFRLFLFPFNLNIDPDFPVFNSSGIERNLISFAIIGFFIYLLIQFKKKSSDDFRKKWLSFGLFWFIITLLPTSGLIPLNELVSEHRVYLPAVGLSLFFSVLLLTAMRNTKCFLKFGKYGVIRNLPIFLIIVFFCFNVMNRNFKWKNDERIWTDALKKSPLKARPHNEVGLVLFSKNQFNKAEGFFNKALELNPQYGHTQVNLGNLYSGQGKLEEAILRYKTAIKLNRASYFAQIGLGNVFVQKGQLQDAQTQYKMAVSLKPDHPLARYNLGRVYELLNKKENALTYYKSAINIDPDFFLALNNLGVIYIHQGRYDEAIILLSKAVDLNQDYFEAFSNLGAAYHFLENIDLAKKYYRRALEINPNYQMARENFNKLILSNK